MLRRLSSVGRKDSTGCGATAHIQWDSHSQSLSDYSVYTATNCQDPAGRKGDGKCKRKNCVFREGRSRKVQGRNHKSVARSLAPEARHSQV